jgi:hypothetical protein
MSEYNAHITDIYRYPDDPDDKTEIYATAMFAGHEFDLQMAMRIIPESERAYVREGAWFRLDADAIEFSRQQWTESELAEHRREASALAKQLGGNQ